MRARCSRCPKTMLFAPRHVDEGLHRGRARRPNAFATGMPTISTRYDALITHVPSRFRPTSTASRSSTIDGQNRGLPPTSRARPCRSNVTGLPGVRECGSARARKGCRSTVQIVGKWQGGVHPSSTSPSLLESVSPVRGLPPGSLTPNSVREPRAPERQDFGRRKRNTCACFGGARHSQEQAEE